MFLFYDSYRDVLECVFYNTIIDDMIFECVSYRISLNALSEYTEQFELLIIVWRVFEIKFIKV